MRVLLFGPLAELAGWRERMESPASDVEELRQRLAADDPSLGAALCGAGVQVAVDQKLRKGPAPLKGAREVAFLPPMSGG
jgi:molybdopterin synthase sulfur carrier subunit